MVQKETSVASKNNARFIHCISKINDVQIDNAEDLDVLMPMYNFLKYKKKKKKIGNLWNCYRDEPSNTLSSNFKSFKYKTSITGNIYDGHDDADKVGKNKNGIIVPLKHLNNFLRT